MRVNAILGSRAHQYRWKRAGDQHTPRHKGNGDQGLIGRRWHSRPSTKADRHGTSDSVCATDEELVARVQGGDIQAFDTLALRHQRRIRQLAMTLMRNEHDAQEIAQEALLRAYLAIRRFRGASSFYTWLHRIVVNLAIDAKRQPFKQRLDWESIADRVDDTRAFDLPRMRNADPHEAAQRAELRRQLTIALAQLSPLHRTVIVMREVEGMSYQDMAEELCISKGTVMSRLFHARRRLQGCATNFVPL